MLPQDWNGCYLRDSLGTPPGLGLGWVQQQLAAEGSSLSTRTVAASGSINDVVRNWVITDEA
jgi:hypothetical protein